METQEKDELIATLKELVASQQAIAKNLANIQKTMNSVIRRVPSENWAGQYVSAIRTR